MSRLSSASLVPRTGAFLLAYLLFVSPLPADIVFSDPAGDTFGTGPIQQDILSVGSSLSATSITFDVTFAGLIAAPSTGNPRSVLGYLDIDIDQNPLTGRSPTDVAFTIARGGAAVRSGLGIEYFLDFFGEIATPGSLALVDAQTLQRVADVPITLASTSFSVNVPLSLLDGDDGLVHYGVVLGTFVEVTDEARNAGLPPATSEMIPEPAGVALFAAGFFGLLLYSRFRARRRVTRYT